MAPLDALVRTVSQPEVTVGGVRVVVRFSGLAPGFAGLFQVQVELVGVGPGMHELRVTLGGQTSPPAQLPVQ